MKRLLIGISIVLLIIYSIPAGAISILELEPDMKALPELTFRYGNPMDTWLTYYDKEGNEIAEEHNGKLFGNREKAKYHSKQLDWGYYRTPSRHVGESENLYLDFPVKTPRGMAVRFSVLFNHEGKLINFGYNCVFDAIKPPSIDEVVKIFTSLYGKPSELTTTKEGYKDGLDHLTMKWGQDSWLYYPARDIDFEGYNLLFFKGKHGNGLPWYIRKSLDKLKEEAP